MEEVAELEEDGVSERDSVKIETDGVVEVRVGSKGEMREMGLERKDIVFSEEEEEEGVDNDRGSEDERSGEVGDDRAVSIVSLISLVSTEVVGSDSTVDDDDSDVVLEEE